MKITKLAELPLNLAGQAWRLSRDPEVETPLHEVLAVDAPVNEMPCYVLHFENFTIIEREIFTTPRNHVVWARTSRVDNPLAFTVPPEFEAAVPTAQIRANMAKLKNTGKQQDEWRALLPLMAHTNWIGRLSLRDLIKMAKYFDYLAGKLDGPLVQRFSAIAAALLAHVPYQIDYKLDLFLNEEHVHKEDGRLKFGAWTVLHVSVPLMLRAQIVRHRPIHFIDDLFSLIRGRANIMKMNLCTPVTMELCAPDSFWHHIMAKRNCWIAQADLWQPITMFFTDTTLPCIDGKCPYEADNRLRMEKKDPNPPCPIFMELNKLDKEPWRAAMAMHAQAKPAWWQERINRY
jgi:hypothetical protein